MTPTGNSALLFTSDRSLDRKIVHFIYTHRLQVMIGSSSFGTDTNKYKFPPRGHAYQGSGARTDRKPYSVHIIQY